MKEKNFYCVILAGGKGKRLWPCSRDKYPKQFIDFFGSGRTLLQTTFDRISNIIPKDNIYISTSTDYQAIVKKQLPNMSDNNILCEPVNRNTAPSVAWACHRISKLNDKAAVLVTPSDLFILKEDSFKTNIEEGLNFVMDNDILLTMGIKPTRPEPGYGYIQLGEPSGIQNVYKVKSFTEKPEREFAQMFMDSGEFYWNTGLFLGNVSTLITRFSILFPEILRRLEATYPHHTVEREQEFINENFPIYPNISMDFGVLENNDNVYVMKCDFGWADLGTWHSIYECMRKGEEDNVVIDSEVMLENSKDNVIKLPKNKLGVISGLEGYIVAEENNVLLICKKGDSSSLIRKYVNEVQIKYGDEFV